MTYFSVNAGNIDCHKTQILHGNLPESVPLMSEDGFVCFIFYLKKKKCLNTWCWILQWIFSFNATCLKALKHESG